MRVLFIFIFLSTMTFSQSNDANDENNIKSNNLSFTIGSAVLANGAGLTYQRIVKPKHKKLVCFTISAANFFF